MTWSIILLLSTLALVALPLVPAVMELLFPTDDKPLRVVQAHDGHIQHFANGFRHFAENKLVDISKSQATSPSERDPSIYYQTDEITPIVIPEKKNIRQLILSRFPLNLPPNKYYESEIYSSRAIYAGYNNYFRAVLGKEDVFLGEDCNVLRWVHSDTSLYVQKGSKLYGRASANQKIVLEDTCEFERLQASRIEFGSRASSTPSAIVPDMHNARMFISELPDTHSHFERRWVVKASLNFPKQSEFDGDIIAKSHMQIGANAKINGSLKSNGNCIISKKATINGSVISTENLHISEDCKVKGPVISESAVYISAGTVIGSEHMPTTVSAPNITIEPGAVIYGAVWATVEGRVGTYKTPEEKVAI